MLGSGAGIEERSGEQRRGGGIEQRSRRNRGEKGNRGEECGKKRRGVRK